jgi:hypothetical protein
MGLYRVNHNYAAASGEKTFGPWDEGVDIEVDDADATWINTDSPDTLTALGAPEGAIDGAGAPSPTAKKADWVAYAEGLGIDVDGLTRDQIVEKVAASEAESEVVDGDAPQA